jgi:5-methylcytosine-specific restriction endonuclease McrA
MTPKVLKLAPSGIPVGWMSLEDAASKMFKDNEASILWTLGDDAFVLRGGFNSVTGQRSKISIPAVIAVAEAGSRGHNMNFQGFSADICKYREGMSCGYCGNMFSRGSLTIDHIFPKSKGGPLTMENSIASCVKCNNKKADRTPEEANMPLILEPFVPTMAEVMYMVRMGRVLGIQEEYLAEQFQNIDKRSYLKIA